MRGSRTVLRGPGGEVPLGYSLNPRTKSHLLRTRLGVSRIGVLFSAQDGQRVPCLVGTATAARRRLRRRSQRLSRDLSLLWARDRPNRSQKWIALRATVLRLAVRSGGSVAVSTPSRAGRRSGAQQIPFRFGWRVGLWRESPCQSSVAGPESEHGFKRWRKLNGKAQYQFGAAYHFVNIRPGPTRRSS